MNTKRLNTKIIRTLVKKEMLDVLRDKKTVLMMLVVPLVLYPLRSEERRVGKECRL